MGLLLQPLPPLLLLKSQLPRLPQPPRLPLLPPPPRLQLPPLLLQPLPPLQQQQLLLQLLLRRHHLLPSVNTLVKRLSTLEAAENTFTVWRMVPRSFSIAAQGSTIPCRTHVSPRR